MNDMEITIRQATPDDLARLEQLGTELMRSHQPFDPLLRADWYKTKAGRDYLLEGITGHGHVCFVAELQGEIIGYASCKLLPAESWRPVKRAELEELIVAQRYQSHGVGQELMAAFKAWGRKQGAVKFKVIVDAHNRGAQRFYERHGFTDYHFILEADA